MGQIPGALLQSPVPHGKDELNPTRMTKEVRQKLALSRLNTGQTDSYRKTAGTRTGSWPSRSWAARCFPVKSSTTSTATKET